MKEHEYIIKPIAYIKNALNTKFGVPRQSGLAKELVSQILFEPEYRNPEALRGITDFSHLWLVWGFSEARRESWSPTVRPPRLGGNERVGVFATRSPYRPNSLALSCVKLEGIKTDGALGDILEVTGADLMNGTPIYDIKPYLPYADCIENADCGFAPDGGKLLKVNYQCEFPKEMAERDRTALTEILARDPRPQYHDDATRIYGMSFGKYEVKFRAETEDLFVIAIENA